MKSVTEIQYFYELFLNAMSDNITLYGLFLPYTQCLHWATEIHYLA